MCLKILGFFTEMGSSSQELSSLNEKRFRRFFCSLGTLNSLSKSSKSLKNKSVEITLPSGNLLHSS